MKTLILRFILKVLELLIPAFLKTKTNVEVKDVHEAYRDSEKTKEVLDNSDPDAVADALDRLHRK